MLSLLISLVPVAFAGSMSTVPLTVTIIILLAPNAHRGALLFLIGSFTGTLFLVGGAAMGLRFTPVRDGPDSNARLAVVALVVAAAVIGYGIYLLTRAPRTDTAALNKMRTRVDSAHPWQFLFLGLALNLRPKAILLSLTAGTLIGLQDLRLLPATLVVLAYVLLAQAEILVPIILRIRRPERAEAMLTSLDAWMQRNSQRITGVTLVIAGLFIAWLGITRF